MTTRIARKRRIAAPRAARGWRSWLVVCVLLAVAWPAAGPLPWLAAEHVAGHRGSASHPSGHHATTQAAPGEALADRGDGDVPGSPTHPLDHDCAQCQVLKHLARCVLPDAVEATVPPPPGRPVHAVIAADGLRAGISIPRPLIRGPPLLLS